MDAIKNPAEPDNREMLSRFTNVDRLYIMMRIISGENDDGDLSHLYQFWAKTASSLDL